MLAKTLALVLIIVTIQVVASSSIASAYWFGSGVAVVEGADAVERGRTLSAGDVETLDEIDENWKRTERIVGLSIFGIFFIVGMYWWTSGKLHHKLPRY